MKRRVNLDPVNRFSILDKAVYGQFPIVPQPIYFDESKIGNPLFGFLTLLVV